MTAKHNAVFRGIRFKLADSRERARAVAMRRVIYAAELGSQGVDAFDQVADHLIALDAGGEIISALRIIGPAVRPLEIEGYVQLSRFIDPGRVPAQIGGFWVRPDQRRVSRTSMIHLGMLQFASKFLLDLRVTDVTAYTVPKLRVFYGRAGFRSGDPETFTHPIWGRVCLLHLDLRGPNPSI